MAALLTARDATVTLCHSRTVALEDETRVADLVVLDADPSADIRNSEKVAKVMLGGRLYDSRTMNEEVTGTAKRRPYYWQGGPTSASTVTTTHGAD